MHLFTMIFLIFSDASLHSKCPIVHDTVPHCTNDIGEISNKPINLCEDDTVHILYDKTNEKLDLIPRDTVIFYIYTDPFNPWGTKVELLPFLDFKMQGWMNFGRTYFVGARLGRADGKGGIDLLKGCLKDRTGTPFTYFATPKPFAGNDTSICGTSFELQGKISNSYYKAHWSVKNGKDASFINEKDPNSFVDIIEGSGKYTFVLEESNEGSCPVKDEVCITFKPNVIVEDLDKKCISYSQFGNNDGKYLAKVKITEGLPPFILIPPATLNGRIIGNSWCSDTLKNLEDFIIAIRDQNGCESSVFVDTYSCNCIPAIPALLSDSLSVICYSSCVQINEVRSASYDTQSETVNYLLFQILPDHSKKILDTLYSSSTLICPQTYKNLDPLDTCYIVQTVGMDMQPKDGIVDITSDCYQSSNLQKFLIDKASIANAGKDTIIETNSIQLEAIISYNSNSVHWREKNDRLVEFSDPSILNPVVKLLDGAGIYTFVLTAMNETLCSIIDEVKVTYKNCPEIEYTDLGRPFNLNNRENNCLIAIIKYGLKPYKLLQGNGKIYQDQNAYFVSKEINPDSLTTIVVEDANGCIGRKEFYLKDYDSPSISCSNVYAGTLDTNALILCHNDCMKIVEFSPSTFIPELQTEMSIVHKGNYNSISDRLDTILNGLPVICNNGKYSESKIYVTRVVGFDLFPHDGIVDYIDPCIRASNNATILLYNTQSNAGNSDNTCANKYQLKASINTGIGKWNLLNAPGSLSIDSEEKPNAIIEFSKNGTYILEWQVSENKCTARDTINLGFYNKPIAIISGKRNLDRNEIIEVSGTKSICNSPANLQYNWTTKNGHFVNGADIHLSKVLIDSSGIYSLQVMDNLTQCYSDQKNIRISKILMQSPDKVNKTDSLLHSTNFDLRIGSDEELGNESPFNKDKSLQLIQIFDLTGKCILQLKNKRIFEVEDLLINQDINLGIYFFIGTDNNFITRGRIFIR